MPLLRCASCRALVELARPVAVERCRNCGGALLPAGGVPRVVYEDEPTRRRVMPVRPPSEQHL